MTSERVVLSFTHDGEISEEQLDDFAEKMLALFPGARLEDCYTEDAS